MDGEGDVEQPGTGAKWGLAAVLGCGACCGGLAGTAAWAGTTAATLGALAAGGAVAGLTALAAGIGFVAWRRRARGAGRP